MKKLLLLKVWLSLMNLTLGHVVFVVNGGVVLQEKLSFLDYSNEKVMSIQKLYPIAPKPCCKVLSEVILSWIQ